MKLSYSAVSTAVTVFVFGSIGCDGFSVPVTSSASTASSTTTTTTQLDAIMDRRKVLNTLAVSSVTLSTIMGSALPAFAAEYVPKLQDMQQIYFLGASLDKLISKLETPDQLELALSGVKAFNKEPTFYSAYAQNFIKKTVKNNSDSDPRVGYIKQASTLIGSLQNLLEGGDALMNEKTVSAEAIKRVQKAQSLISKFIEESGVQDVNLAAYVSSHK